MKKFNPFNNIFIDMFEVIAIARLLDLSSCPIDANKEAAIQLSNYMVLIVATYMHEMNVNTSIFSVGVTS